MRIRFACELFFFHDRQSESPTPTFATPPKKSNLAAQRLCSTSRCTKSLTRLLTKASWLFHYQSRSQRSLSVRDMVSSNVLPKKLSTMPAHEEITTWAWVIAILAGSNWAFGNRSAFGRELNLRPGPLWRTTRWIGLILFVFAVVIQTQMDDSRFLPTVAILGAILMIIGTARKRVQRPSPIPEQPMAEQVADDQLPAQSRQPKH